MRTAALFFLLAGLVAGQTAPAFPAGKVLDAWVFNVEKDVVPAAEALNEIQFTFAPSNGAFHGVRTFGAQITQPRRRQLSARRENPRRGTSRTASEMKKRPQRSGREPKFWNI